MEQLSIVQSVSAKIPKVGHGKRTCRNRKLIYVFTRVQQNYIHHKNVIETRKNKFSSDQVSLKKRLTLYYIPKCAY